MHVFVLIHKYTQYTHIYYVTKSFILDAINSLTALPSTLTEGASLLHMHTSGRSTDHNATRL